ncbi:MAG: sulfotransferase domain-containing protein [Verrucomicrobia bacterium]|nr:sulfotransferase domain-containing protein [Verrucomicrobiota bacterium]
MRWNLSSRARTLSQADAVVLSIPKSGRTWLRVFVNAYFGVKTGAAFSVNLTDQCRPGIPRIVYSHDRFESLTKGNWWDRVRGKYLVPRAQLTSRRVILLARDPRDAFVSYYVQITRRNHPAPERVKQLAPDQLVRHRRYGINSMVAVMNGWLAEFGDQRNVTILRYESLLSDPNVEFRNVLHGIGEHEIDNSTFAEALRFSAFHNMRQLEERGAFSDKILAPRDRADRQSFKVRQGKVGGFREYLSPAGQQYAAAALARLDPRFGYGEKSG